MTNRRRVGIWLLVFAVTTIVVATLTPVATTSQGPGTRGLCIICHERAFADFLSNVILFAPLGFALAMRGRSMLVAAVVGVLFSGLIEFLQVELIQGRDANLGDVISNGTGAVVGWIAWRTLGWWTPEGGRPWRALVLAAAGGSLLLVALNLFRPDLPEREWFLQWTPQLGGLAQYEGEVLASRLHEIPLAGPGSIAGSDAVRERLFAPHWRVDLRAGPPPDFIAPIVSIYDGRRKEMMLLGAYGDDLVYRQRLRATSRRFDAADLRIEDVFAGVRSGDTVRVEYRADRSRQCVNVNGRERCTDGYTVGDTWSLLMFPDSWGGHMRRAMAFTWLFGVFSLAGFTAPHLRALFGTGCLTIGILMAGPPLLGFAITPVPQVLAALAGLGAGFGASRWSLRARVAHRPTALRQSQSRAARESAST